MWLLPSRNRPGNLARFFEAFNATEGSTYGIVLVSEADYSDNCAAYSEIELPLGWAFHPTKGEKQGEKIAEVWADVKDQPWLGLIGDDCVPRTLHWDKALVDRLDGSNMVSCNDGWQAPNRAANCWIIAGDLVRAVGYVFPPGLQHLFVDNVWETIGRGADCWSCATDVLVEHRHVLNGKAQADSTHRLVYGENFAELGQWPEDFAAFQAWQDGDKARAIAAAKALRPTAAARVSPAAPPGAPVCSDPRTLDYSRLNEREKGLIDRARTQRVMFLTPVWLRPAWQFTDSWGFTISLLERLGIEWDRRFFMGNSDLPQARNILSAQFLEALSPWTRQPFTCAMCIDDDMRWEPSAILRQLASEQMLCGAAGRKKDQSLSNTDQRAWCAYFGSAEMVKDEMGFVRAASGETLMGAAFMRIRREVFEQMMAEYPESKADLPADDRIPQSLEPWFYDFFSRPKGGGGEDYYFCRRWQALGGEVWIDPSIKLGHVGEYEYSGYLGELMGPGEPLTA